MIEADITAKRCGDIAEMYVTSLLLRDPGLEVFTSVSDDGHGSDLAVRSTRTGRWYSVQVKATTSTANPWISLKRFRETEDFLFAAVVLDELRRPIRAYLVPGDAWAATAPACLGKNMEGGALGPYVEVRTGGAKHRGALEAFRLERTAGLL